MFNLAFISARLEFVSFRQALWQALSHLRSKAPKDLCFTLGRQDLQIEGVTHLKADLTDAAAVTAVLERVQPARIYHLAGSSRVASDIGASQSGPDPAEVGSRLGTRPARQPWAAGATLMIRCMAGPPATGRGRRALRAFRRR